MNQRGGHKHITASCFFSDLVLLFLSMYILIIIIIAIFIIIIVKSVFEFVSFLLSSKYKYVFVCGMDVLNVCIFIKQINNLDKQG